MLWLRPQYVGVHKRLSELAQSSGLDTSQVFTIQNAIDFSAFIQTHSKRINTSKEDNASPRGIIVANVRPSKDILMLLRALALIKYIPWKIAIAGAQPVASYLRMCKQRVIDLELDNRVEFLGTRLDVKELVQSADFGVLSSNTESGPLVLLEYAAASLPFVSTRVGQIGKYLDQQGIPEFVSTGDAEQMALAIERLLNQTASERKCRGELGREVAIKTFDIHGVIPTWYEVYNRALHSKRK